MSFCSSHLSYIQHAMLTKSMQKVQCWWISLTLWLETKWKLSFLSLRGSQKFGLFSVVPLRTVFLGFRSLAIPQIIVQWAWCELFDVHTGVLCHATFLILMIYKLCPWLILFFNVDSDFHAWEMIPSVHIWSVLQCSVFLVVGRPKNFLMCII